MEIGACECSTLRYTMRKDGMWKALGEEMCKVLCIGTVQGRWKE